MEPSPPAGDAPVPPDLCVNILTTSDTGPFVRQAERRRPGTEIISVID